MLILVGLIAGIIGTALMSILQYPFYKRWGIIGILEWHENNCLMSMLLKKDYRLLTKEGFILHFLNGIIAAIFYSYIFKLLPNIEQNVMGLMFGTLLWVVTLAPIHKPITGVSILKHPLGIKPILLSLTSHIVYGLTVANLVSLLLK